MKAICILITCVSMCSMYGQDSTYHRGLGIMVAPTYVFRSLRDDGPAGNSAKNYRDSLERDKRSFDLGFIYQKQWRKWGFETGLRFSNKGQQTVNIYNQSGRRPYNPVPSNGNNWTYYTTVYNNRYVGIPLKASYLILDKRAKFFVSAGIVSNLHLESELFSNIYYLDGSRFSVTQENNDTRASFLFEATASAGTRLEVFKNYFLLIEGFYNQALTSIQAIDYLKEYPWSMGVNFGVLYNF